MRWSSGFAFSTSLRQPLCLYLKLIFLREGPLWLVDFFGQCYIAQRVHAVSRSYSATSLLRTDARIWLVAHDRQAQKNIFSTFRLLLNTCARRLLSAAIFQIAWSRCARYELSPYRICSPGDLFGYTRIRSFPQSLPCDKRKESTQILSIRGGSSWGLV